MIKFIIGVILGIIITIILIEMFLQYINKRD
jgi:hypothetical protein